MEYWLADYDGTEPTLWTTREKARAWCDNLASSEARGRCWDWASDGRAEQQIWVADLDSRTAGTAPGRITPLALDAG